MVAEAIVRESSEHGYFASLTVRENNDSKWHSEECRDPSETFAFGSWFDGSGLPVFWGDIDQDGKPELLAPLPKADLSPTVYRIFRWTGEELLFLKKRCLVGVDDNRFHWTAPEVTPDECTWIDHFYQNRNVEVVKLTSSDVSRGNVTVEPTKDGFRISEASE